MRIAWLTYCFEEYSALHVNAMAREHDVLLVMPRGGDQRPNYQLDEAVDHYAFRAPRLRQPLRQLASVRKIVKRIHEFRPDVVHLQQGHLWLNFSLASLRRYPLVITVHDPRHHAGDVDSRKTPQWVMDHGFRKADHLIVHGDALAGEVKEIFGFPADRIHVIPHVVMGQPADDDSVSEDSNLILFFGRIWEYKGLDQLIAAQPLINEAVPEARIMIAGEGEDFGRYRKLMQDPSKFLVHNEWISDDQRDRFFRQAAVIVLPYNEATQSGVVPVAYNYGKPVVATRVGALNECVDDGVTGLLVPPRSRRALADSIIELLTDPLRRKRMGLAGKNWIDRECSPEVVSHQTIDVYRQAIADRDRAAAKSLMLENKP